MELINAKLDHALTTQAILVAQSLDPWDRIEKSSRTTNPARTLKVKDFYGIKEKLFCQVLGEVKEDVNQKNSHQPTVKNAHIWPQHTEGNGLNLFNLSPLDQDSQRNMMRLHFAIEAAFDVKRLCFVGFPQESASPATEASAASSSPLSPVSSSGSRRLFGLRVRVLDPSLLAEPIGITGQTFSDIDGKELTFLNENRPYFRLIYAHKRRSLIHAERKGWIAEGGDEQADDSQRVSDQELLSRSLDSEYSNRITNWLHHRAHSSLAGPAIPLAAAGISSPSLTLTRNAEATEEKTCAEPMCRNSRAGKCPKKLCRLHCEQSKSGLCAEHIRRR